MICSFTSPSQFSFFPSHFFFDFLLDVFFVAFFAVFFAHFAILSPPLKFI